MANVNTQPFLLWPSVPAGLSAQALLLYQQLDKSQWEPLSQIENHQAIQLKVLLEHYAKQLPYWRDLVNSGLDEAVKSPSSNVADLLSLIPVSGREFMREQFVHWPVAAPRSHGKPIKMTTSGSTGKPVSVYRNTIGEIFHQALNLRHHVWHQRDFNRTVFAALRGYPKGDAMYPGGHTSPQWNLLFQSGPSHTLNTAYCTLTEQLQWLEKIKPHYLISYPTNLAQLALLLETKGKAALENLKGVASYSEMLKPSQRKVIEAQFGHRLVDMYSASELGLIALQCPSGDHYHVMSESLIVEVLDENDQPCETGKIGRVVATDLHNFHTPLIRYAIGDYAEVGEACACGRGLPVLNRIFGRERNLLKQPDGELRFPDVASHKLGELGPVRQSRVVQTGYQSIELLLVLERALTAEERRQVESAIKQSIGENFSLLIKEVNQIPVGPNGKYEDFICAF